MGVCKTFKDKAPPGLPSSVFCRGYDSLSTFKPQVFRVERFRV